MAEKERRRNPVSIEHEELRGISRTVAEIHWLLLILVLLYLIFGGPRPDADGESEAAVSAGEASRIRAVRILPRPLERELTPTGKIRRKVVEAEHAELIESMYSGADTAVATGA